MNLVAIDEADLRELGQTAISMATSKGFDAHARAVEKRLED